jgi:hypothetical protein
MAERINKSAKLPLMKNAGAAPFIYFDLVPSMGTQNGVVEVELCARAVMPQSSGDAYSDMVCVAHVRCSAAAAVMLRDTLQRALDMTEQSQLPAKFPGASGDIIAKQ